MTRLRSSLARHVGRGPVPERVATGSRLEATRSLWLLSDCTDRQIRFVNSISSPVIAEAGRTFTRQGTHGREFFITCQGTAAVAIDDQPVALIEPGYFFGELELLCGGPRRATVTAVTPMVLLVLDRREFGSLLGAQIPSITRKMLTVLAARERPATANHATNGAAEMVAGSGQF
jgi:CRP-like cAMP-binding protein